VVCVSLESRQCFSVVSSGCCFAGEVGSVNIHRFMPCCLQVVSAVLVWWCYGVLPWLRDNPG
jgi:hypothetical protein